MTTLVLRERETIGARIRRLTAPKKVVVKKPVIGEEAEKDIKRLLENLAELYGWKHVEFCQRGGTLHISYTKHRRSGISYCTVGIGNLDGGSYEGLVWLERNITRLEADEEEEALRRSLPTRPGT